MADVLLEVLISQRLVYIAEKFQRLPHILGFQELKGSIVNTVQSIHKYTIQDGYRQTSNTLLLLLLLHGC